MAEKKTTPKWKKNPLLLQFASLRLTVVLIALGIVITFFATLAQEEDGIFIVQKEYFYSWYIPHAVDGVPSIDNLDFAGADFVKGFLRMPLPGETSSPCFSSLTLWRPMRCGSS